MMVSKCNNCGKEFYNSKGFCPHCGICINDNEYVKFTCPICKNIVNYYSDFCGNCGFKITKDIYYLIKESNSKSCPNCGNKNNVDAEFCGNCGKTLPLTSDLQLIECPDCKQKVRDDVNYCRFCGHNFLRENKSLFVKKPKKYETYCQNCGFKIRVADNSKFCSNCGTKIPMAEKNMSDQFTTHEDYLIMLTNQLLVPLSLKHNVNFRKIHIRDYYNLSIEQEYHIFYKVIEKIKGSINEDIVLYFEEILEETKNNFNNIEDAIIKEATKSLTDAFNGNGLTSSEVLTIKDDFYKTVETPVIQNKHGAVTKGVATLGFGLIGLAATSGVKQTTSTKRVLNKGDFLHSSVTISSKYIVVKSYTDDSKEKTFHSNKGNLNKTVVYWQDVNSVDHENYLILNTGETFKLPKYDVSNIINNAIDNVVGTLDMDFNKELRKAYYPNIFPIINNLLPNLINDTIKSTKDEIRLNENVNETISNDSKDAQNQTQNNDILICSNCGKPNDNSNKFCGECGSKLETISNYCPKCDKTYDTGEKFCTECGTKLTSKSSKDIIIESNNDANNINSTNNNSQELIKLYEAARRAKDSNNSENAIEYYSQILKKDCNSWEAEFYVIYFRAMSCKIIEIGKASSDLTNSFNPIFNLIKNDVADKKEQVHAINEIYDKILTLAQILFNASKNHYNNIGLSKISLTSKVVKMKYSGPHMERSFSVVNMLYQFGDELNSVFGNDYYLIAMDSWKQAINLHTALIKDVKHLNNYRDKINVYVEKIKQYDSEYIRPR